MECYLNGKLIQSVDVLDLHIPMLFTAAARDEKTGEIILKVVNPGSDVCDGKIKLTGVEHLQPTGKVTILSGNLTDENTLDKPSVVAPKTTDLTDVKADYDYAFQPHSMTVLRLATTPAKN
jgi:alpha-L-arabinofuranosidase